MFSALSPGAIHVTAPDIESAIAAAKKGGFEGVEVSASEVADRVERDGSESIRSLFQQAQVRPAGWGLPTAWQGSQDEFERSLGELPRLAKACAEIGCNRAFTWIMPISDEREFAENYKFHVSRLKPIAEALSGAGCRFGMEFIGPKTIRDRARFPFIYRMGEMLELASDVGPNTGLLLDCWHWYTSGGTLEELGNLKARDVVYVHINDAPAGVEVDRQIDNRRALPGETGVIDIAGFLDALRSMGYDGPIVPEPFKRELADLTSDEERLRVVGESMRRVWR